MDNFNQNEMLENKQKCAIEKREELIRNMFLILEYIVNTWFKFVEVFLFFSEKINGLLNLSFEINRRWHSPFMSGLCVAYYSWWYRIKLTLPRSSLPLRRRKRKRRRRLAAFWRRDASVLHRRSYVHIVPNFVML